MTVLLTEAAPLRAAPKTLLLPISRDRSLRARRGVLLGF
jgi:hypothetical protein